MVGQVYHSRSDANPPDHQIEHERTRPIGLLTREGCRSRLGKDNKRHLWQCGEGEARL
jgi:hypothetical protein